MEQIKVLLNGSVSIGAVLAGLGERTAIFAKLVRRKIADVRLAVLYKLFSVFVAKIKVVRAIENATRRCTAKPCKVLVNALYVLVVLL